MRWLRRGGHVAAVAAVIAAATAGARADPGASPGSGPDASPSSYVCRITRSGDFGQVWYQLDVPVDGGAPFHRINWQLLPRGEGLGLSASWYGAPTNGHLDDRGWVNVSFETKRSIRDRVRLEIRRTPGPHYASEFAYAGPFLRLYRPSAGANFHIEAAARWGELDAWTAGEDALTVALVRADGKVAAEDRLQTATLAGAVAAIVAARPQVEAMAADYRHRCEAAGPIVVTGAPH